MDVNTEKTNDHRDWFKRSTYKLFTNMSQNLVQSPRARKIMLAWRAQAADSKSSEHNIISAKSVNEGMAHFEEADKEEAGDDIHVVMEVMRKQNGEQTGAARKRSKLIDQYLTDQINSLDDIFKVSEINKSSSYSTLKRFRKRTRNRIAPLPFKNVKIILRNLKLS